MNPEHDAEMFYDKHGDGGCAEEAAWESFFESATEDARFTDEDGEWLPGFPEALADHEVWLDYVKIFMSNLEEIHSEVSTFAGWENYYGTSRSD